MGYSAFQGSAFQRNAFQINGGGSAPGIVYGGGGYWDRVKHAVKEREDAERKLAENKHLAEEKRLEIERKQAELAAKRKLDIQARWVENEITALNKELLLIQQQNILLLVLIEFWLLEEEDIYIILMCTV